MDRFLKRAEKPILDLPLSRRKDCYRSVKLFTVFAG